MQVAWCVRPRLALGTIRINIEARKSTYSVSRQDHDAPIRLLITSTPLRSALGIEGGTHAEKPIQTIQTILDIWKLYLREKMQCVAVSG